MYTTAALNRRNAFGLSLGKPTGLVAGFSLWGAKTPKSYDRKGWPLFRATIVDTNNIVIAQRESWNDCELARWIESFGFELTNYDALSLAAD